MKQPNILFIFSTPPRCARLCRAFAGRRRIWMADWGMRFERTWTQCPVCMPCRATMITGRYTHELGFTSNVTADHGDTVADSPFKPAWPTIMKQLQGGGYETASIGKTHYHGRPGSMEAGERGESFDTRQFGDFVKGFGWDYVMEEYDRYGHVQRHVKSPYMDYLEARGLRRIRNRSEGFTGLRPHIGEARRVCCHKNASCPVLLPITRWMAEIARFREALLSSSGFCAAACSADG